MDVGFFYDAKDVEKVRDITLNISNATLENVLSRLFAGTGFTYEILDDNVVITREKVVVEQKSIPMQKIKITVRDAGFRRIVNWGDGHNPGYNYRWCG